MTPITEDIVCALMEGFQRRETSRGSGAAPDEGTARILQFSPRGHSALGGRVISLDVARARRNVSGLICTAARG